MTSTITTVGGGVGGHLPSSSSGGVSGLSTLAGLSTNSGSGLGGPISSSGASAGIPSPPGLPSQVYMPAFSSSSIPTLPSSSSSQLQQQTAPIQGVDPTRQRLFAAWDLDKGSSNSVPRLCTLRLTKLSLVKAFGQEVSLSSIIIAVKMQSLKRTLRSNDIRLVPGSGNSRTAVPVQTRESHIGDREAREIDLDLTFSLQYPHILKPRPGSNKLQILLQRRKRYKNRAILGFKTLARGMVDMGDVLQRPQSAEGTLDLVGSLPSSSTHHYQHSHNTSSTAQHHQTHNVSVTSQTLPGSTYTAAIDAAETGQQVIGQLSISVLRSTYLLDQDGGGAAGSRANGKSSGSSSKPTAAMKLSLDRSGEVESDEDDFSSNEEMADQVASMAGHLNRHHHHRNLKSSAKAKFISLLKRFRVTEETDDVPLDPDDQEMFLNAAAAAGVTTHHHHRDTDELGDADLDEDLDLFEEDEAEGDFSDSDSELSISSSPKPRLRPFFASGSTSCTSIPIADRTVGSLGEGRRSPYPGTSGILSGAAREASAPPATGGAGGGSGTGTGDDLAESAEEGARLPGTSTHPEGPAGGVPPPGTKERKHFFNRFSRKV